MSETLEDGIKRWTAKHKSALVVEIIQAKTTIAEASRTDDQTPLEIEGWVDDTKRGTENALKANPLDIREQYEKHSRISRKPTARRCLSCAREKVPGPAGMSHVRPKV